MLRHFYQVIPNVRSEGSVMEAQERRKWLEWVLLTSIPLRRYAPDETPIGVASGCLVDYRDRRFILTAAHAVGLGSSDWAIELGYVDGRGTEFYRPFSFSYLAEMTRGIAAINEIDYCYAEVSVDVEPTFEHRTPLGPQSKRLPRHVFDFSEITEPDRGELYAFSGQVHPELHGRIAIVTEPTVYPGLCYRGSDGPFLEFTLPVEHPGHDAFRGCSGAPIVDTKRRLVGIISHGDDETDAVYGVSLTRYKFAFDFHCDEIRPS